jgi:uncharacterized protein (DUF433 family)
MRKVVIHPDICNGLPTIEGTRISVHTVLEFLAAGDTVEDVLREYPSLSHEDVLGCLAYSAQMLKHHFSVKEVA